MATNQGDRQASVRAVTGTSYTYEGDWHALFDLAGVPAGDFNGRLLSWINLRLNSNYATVSDAMAAFAIAQGASSWSGLGSFLANPIGKLNGRVLNANAGPRGGLAAALRGAITPNATISGLMSVKKALIGSIVGGATFTSNLSGGPGQLRGGLSSAAILTGMMTPPLIPAVANGTTLYVSEGDSITADGNAYSRKFAATDATNITFIDAAVSGNKLADLVARKATVKGYIAANNKQNNILTVLVGTNQPNGGDTTYYPSNPSGFVSDYCAYLSEMRAAGYYVIAISVLPRVSSLGAFTFDQATWDSYVTAVNNGIAAQEGTSFDKFVNLYNDPNIGYSQKSNTAIYPDGLHPSNLGHVFLERGVAPSINSAIAAGSRRLTGSISNGAALTGNLTGVPPSTGATFDPARKGTNVALSNSNRDLFYTTSDTGFSIAALTSAVTGKAYVEFTATTTYSIPDDGFAVITSATNLNDYPGDGINPGTMLWFGTGVAQYFVANGFTYGPNTTVPSNTTTVGDKMMVAIDAAAGKVWFGRNGAWYGTGDPASGANQNINFVPGTTVYPAMVQKASSTAQVFRIVSGAGYTPPTGFTSLNG